MHELAKVDLELKYEAHQVSTVTCEEVELVASHDCGYQERSCALHLERLNNQSQAGLVLL